MLNGDVDFLPSLAAKVLNCLLCFYFFFLWVDCLRIRSNFRWSKRGIIKRWSWRYTLQEINQATEILRDNPEKIHGKSM